MTGVSLGFLLLMCFSYGHAPPVHGQASGSPVAEVAVRQQRLPCGERPHNPVPSRQPHGIERAAEHSVTTRREVVDDLIDLLRCRLRELLAPRRFRCRDVQRSELNSHTGFTAGSRVRAVRVAISSVAPYLLAWVTRIRIATSQVEPLSHVCRLHRARVGIHERKSACVRDLSRPGEPAISPRTHGLCTVATFGVTITVGERHT